MSSEKFKQELKQEAEQWRVEGLINQEFYDVLAQRYQSLGIIAFILIAVSYFSTFNIFAWENNYLTQLAPILFVALFIPLAYICRSTWLFFLASCLTIIAFSINCLYDFDFISIPLRGIIFAIAFAIPLAFFWSYQDQPKLFNWTTPLSFSVLSQKIVVFYLSLLLYLSSFHWLWNYSTLETLNSTENKLNLLVFGNILAFSVIALYWWWQLGKRRNNNTLWRLDQNSIFMAIAIVTASILTAWNFNIAPIGYLGTIIFNLMLFFLSLILIRQALKSGKRFGYWSGILLLSLQVLSRMFEYNTGLLTKAFVLFICGVAVIMAGIWFEKRLAKLHN